MFSLNTEVEIPETSEVRFIDTELEKLDYNGYICSVTTNKDQASQETVLD